MFDNVLDAIRITFTVQDAGKRAYQSIWIFSRRRHWHGSVMENCWIPRGHPPDRDQVEDRVQTLKEHHDRAVLSWKRPKQMKNVWSIH